jgi:hypothetical protein
MEIIQIIEERLSISVPQDLKDFWHKPYNKTFSLYSWPNTFSILNPSSIAEEAINFPDGTETSIGNDIYYNVSEEVYHQKRKTLEYDLLICTNTLNEFHPGDRGIYFQVYKLLAFAREDEGGEHILAYGFDQENKNIGIFLWSIDGNIEYPIFIANSVNDLVQHHVIKIEPQNQFHFDAEKYLNETFEKHSAGYILQVRFNLCFNKGDDIHDHFKKLVEFYETAFRKLKSGTIEFSASGDLINISISEPAIKRIAINVHEVDVFEFIEILNYELNSIQKVNFCRPSSFGFFLIKEKYLVCLRKDIATDLIQKGYIKAMYKMLPMEVFCHPQSIARTLEVYRILTQFDKESNKKITWIE